MSCNVKHSVIDDFYFNALYSFRCKRGKIASSAQAQSVHFNIKGKKKRQGFFSTIGSKLCVANISTSFCGLDLNILMCNRVSHKKSPSSQTQFLPKEDKVEKKVQSVN